MAQTNQTNLEEILQLAISRAKEGSNEGARVLFQQVLAQDKRNERALMWMAKLADDPTERKRYLKQVLKVNPNNSTAQQALRKMEYTRAARDNRVLITFGVIAVTLVIVVVLVLLIALGSQPA